MERNTEEVLFHRAPWMTSSSFPIPFAADGLYTNRHTRLLSSAARFSPYCLIFFYCMKFFIKEELKTPHNTWFKCTTFCSCYRKGNKKLDRASVIRACSQVDSHWEQNAADLEALNKVQHYINRYLKSMNH